MYLKYPYFSEIKSEIVKHFKEYNVLFFDEITKANYPIEFYLDAICPKAIFGDISSGLFYSKVLMPEIKIYTYHEYVIAYQLQHFGSFHSDYNWLDRICYNRFLQSRLFFLFARISVSGKQNDYVLG